MGVLDDVGAAELLTELERAQAPGFRRRELLELDVREAEVEARIVQSLFRAELFEELDRPADQRNSLTST